MISEDLQDFSDIEQEQNKGGTVYQVTFQLLGRGLFYQVTVYQVTFQLSGKLLFYQFIIRYHLLSGLEHNTS